MPAHARLTLCGWVLGLFPGYMLWVPWVRGLYLGGAETALLDWNCRGSRGLRGIVCYTWYGGCNFIKYIAVFHEICGGAPMTTNNDGNSMSQAPEQTSEENPGQNHT